MIFFQWQDQYSVGINSIDQEHQEIFRLLEEFYHAFKRGIERHELKKMLDFLANYAVTHFATEERYMEQFSFPGYEAHKQEHHLFIERIKGFQDQFENGERMLSLLVSNFVKNWMEQHILNTDQQYSNFLVGKGAT